MDTETLLLCFALFFIAALYASVGHGGASGYLALLSLSTFASMNSAWLKQHAWVLNLVVASLAFYHFQKAGYHESKIVSRLWIIGIFLAVITILTLKIIPIAIQVIQADVPPLLISGRVCPVTGKT